MLIGQSTGERWARAASHSSSPHSYDVSKIRDAVSAGTSAQAAIGSAFSRHAPSGPRITNLYAVPLPTPGTKSSQTPDEPSWRIGCSRPSQLLKSALTRTACAEGAHTAKDVPVTGSSAPG